MRLTNLRGPLTMIAGATFIGVGGICSIPPLVGVGGFLTAVGVLCSGCDLTAPCRHRNNVAHYLGDGVAAQIARGPAQNINEKGEPSPSSTPGLVYPIAPNPAREGVPSGVASPRPPMDLNVVQSAYATHSY